MMKKEAVCGGHSEDKPMTSELTLLVFQFKGKVESKLKKLFTTYTPLSYATQIVAGKNYHVKVAVNGKKTIMVTICEPLHGGAKFLVNAVYI